MKTCLFTVGNYLNEFSGKGDATALQQALGELGVVFNGEVAGRAVRVGASAGEQVVLPGIGLEEGDLIRRVMWVDYLQPVDGSEGAKPVEGRLGEGKEAIGAPRMGENSDSAAPVSSFDHVRDFGHNHAIVGGADSRAHLICVAVSFHEGEEMRDHVHLAVEIRQGLSCVGKGEATLLQGSDDLAEVGTLGIKQVVGEGEKRGWAEGNVVTKEVNH